jgi:Tol biopolymer transport system component
MEGQRALYTIDLEKGNLLKPLTKPPEGKDFAGPSWSPDGSQIALYIYRDQMLIIDSHSGDIVRAFPACNSPTWHPYGELVICNSMSDEEGFNIFDTITGHMAGSVDPHVDGAYLPAWSPNGNEIAFARFQGNFTCIWKFPLSGGGPIMLAGNATENYAPAWSPDGQWIAYQSNDGSLLSEIWIMDKEGQQAKRITYTPTGWSRGPAWSPDGRWIAFVSSQSGSAGDDLGEIFIAFVDTGDIYQITSTNGEIYDWRVSWTR